MSIVKTLAKLDKIREMLDDVSWEFSGLNPKNRVHDDATVRETAAIGKLVGKLIERLTDESEPD